MARTLRFLHTLAPPIHRLVRVGFGSYGYLLTPPSRKGARLAELFELQITMFLALLLIKVSVAEVGLHKAPLCKGGCQPC